MAKILRVQGWRACIVVSRRSGFIVKGHCRLESAKVGGFGQVPVEYQNYDSDDLEQADLLADNRIAELADLDLKAVREILEKIDTGLLDMDITGFKPEDLEALMVAPEFIGSEDEYGGPRTNNNMAQTNDSTEFVGLQCREIMVVLPIAVYESLKGVVMDRALYESPRDGMIAVIESGVNSVRASHPAGQSTEKK